MTLSDMRKQYRKWLKEKAEVNDRSLIRRLSEILPADYLRDLYQGWDATVAELRQAFRDDGYVAWSQSDMTREVSNQATASELREWWSKHRSD